MRRECRERFPRHRLQRKPLVSDPGVHHGTCVTHVPWCMSGSQTRGGGENVPGIRGACVTRNFTYMVRGPMYICDICLDKLKASTFLHLLDDNCKYVIIVGQIHCARNRFICWVLPRYMGVNKRGAYKVGHGNLATNYLDSISIQRLSFTVVFPL